MRGPGRPPKKPAERRNVMCQFRCTAGDYKLFIAAAKRSKKSFSTWLRDQALKGAEDWPAFAKRALKESP